MPLITIHKLYKSYNHTAALKSVNIDIHAGEIFGLIGPDGAGKTTLLRILATVLPYDSGTIHIDNFDIKRNYKELRRIIGYVPSKFSLYHDLTIEENLHFFADLYNTKVKDNYDIIHDIYTHLAPFKHRKAGKLSGGMKQKLALCCALIHKPKILLLDEPTTGIDPVSRKELWDVLTRLKQENITIIVSTPYMDEASLCSRIALIQLGSILAIQTPQHIIAQYPHPLFATKTNNSYKLLTELKNHTNIIESYACGEYVHIVPLQADDSHTLKIDNNTFYKITPTIEDCFIQLMNNPLVQ